MHQWGARSIPFTDQHKPELFETDQFIEAMEFLYQSAALRSVMLLSGINGVGKSALIAQWTAQLEPKAYLPLIITHASLGASGVLSMLLSKLGQGPAYRRSTALSRIEDAIRMLGSVTPVIILDDAQNYTASTLEEIRLLLGLNLPAQSAFSLIMVGDTYLLDSLRMQSRRALYTRIAISYQLAPLKPCQIKDYFTHALQKAGIEKECFDDTAIDIITAASNGVPRTINILARTAWIEASRQQSTVITTAHVNNALRLVPSAKDKIAAPTNG